MGCAVIKTGHGHITHKRVIDEATLDRVADALGIPAAQRRQFIPSTEAIYIYRGAFRSAGTATSPGTATSAGTPTSPSTPTSPPGGGRP